jgi:YVTN family beta-propeller protein
MRIEIIYYFLAGLMILSSGCKRDEIVDSNYTSVATTKKGLYTLTEGQSGVLGTSKLSFYDFDTLFYCNIFQPGSLGNAPDGLIYDGTNLLITEQGTYSGQGKIYRVDTSGTVIKSEVVGINPYSLCIANNKIYVTNGPANNVSVLDFDNLTTIKTIDVGVFPQEILSYNKKVFVCNTGFYSGPYDSTVTVIDAQSDTVAGKIILQQVPASIVLSNDNKFLIGCNNRNGYIYKVDPDSYAKLDSFNVYSVGGFCRDISVDKSSYDIYFISYTNNIVKLNLLSRLSETMISNPSPSGVYFYGYIFDSKRRNHYVANARTFTSNGIVHKYDIYGNMLSFYTTGYAPRRFLIFDN